MLLASFLAVLTFLASVGPAAAETLVGSLTTPNANLLDSAVIDSVHGFAYFGTDTSPGVIVKVNLSTFTEVATLQPGANCLTSAVIDVPGGFAYFGSFCNGVVVKIRLSDFSVNGTLMVSSQIVHGVIDTLHGFAYFNDFANVIFRIRLSDFTNAGFLELPATATPLYTSVIDPSGGFAYFASCCGAKPYNLYKVRLSDFTVVDRVPLNDPVVSAAIDTSNGFAYFGIGTSPGQVVKVRLSDLKRVGSLQLNPGEDFPDTAVINTASGFAYFGTETTPGIIIKVNTSTLTETGSLTLPASDCCFIKAAIIDIGAGFAYFGGRTTPGIIAKIGL